MLAFTQIPETVDGSFEAILRRSYGLNHCNVLIPKSRRDSRRQLPRLGGDELARCQYVYPRLQSVSGRALAPYVELSQSFPKIRFYTFLREPLERCAAEFVRSDGLKRGPKAAESFDDWIQDPLNRNRQCLQICGAANSQLAIHAVTQQVGFVGLIERFHESLVLFSRWTGNPRIDIRYHLKKQTHEHSLKRKLLKNLHSRRQLIEANREDVRLYDFVARELFLKQCETYGDRLETDVQAFEAFNIPPSRFPREVASLAFRELVYRPVSGFLMSRTNPPLQQRPAAMPQRRAA